MLKLEPDRVALAALVSVGLYGFGMSLNDIIDRRRDSQLAPGRPLPSGRLDLYTAYGICAALALLALVCGYTYYRRGGPENGDAMSVALVVGTGLLISFYDIAGKYLVAPGLLALGLIRFFHALIPDPSIPLLWHPLLLLNHVTILSTVAYVWEEKRPALTKLHLWTVALGLLAANALGVMLVILRRPDDWHERLALTWPLAVPAAAAVAFVLVAWTIKSRAHTSREAGQRTMLFGLLWLIVYDAAFVAAFVRSWLATAAVLLMFPVAYFSVQLMRWWAKLLTLSQRPTFKRAKT
jgi:hypothetical protein